MNKELDEYIRTLESAPDLQFPVSKSERQREMERRGVVFRGQTLLDNVAAFDPHKLARTTDPDTSKEAAHSAESLRELHVNKICNALSEPGTAEEIGDRCGLDSVAVNRRLKEIETAGLIERTTERKKKRSGRTAIVWRRRV